MNKKNVSFTLLIFLIFGSIGYFIYSKLSFSKDRAVMVEMKRIGEFLDEYRYDCKLYPKTEEGLDKLIRDKSCSNFKLDGYIPGGSVPKDPWDQNFRYESDGKTYKIWTMHDGEIFSIESNERIIQ